MSLRGSVAMATPKVQGDQKPFENVYYMLKLKVTKFQYPTPNNFRPVLKKTAGGHLPPPLLKIGLTWVFVNRQSWGGIRAHPS